jgi:hypothetical protein
MHKLLRVSLLACLLMVLANSQVAAESLSEILQEKTSLTIERDSLEGALASLVKQVAAKHPGFAIKLLGNDLNAEGITRNQVIKELKLADQSVADILTTIAMRANPRTDFKSPADPNLRLIWVIGPDPDEPKREAILFTTRAAAEKRGDKLPPAFQMPKR